MNSKNRVLFSDFTSENWKNLILFAIVCVYFFIFISAIRHGISGGDYEAYWIIGKIADEKGYSEIYNLSVQTQELKEWGLIGKSDDISYPVPYFSFFILPFHLLSKVPLVSSYWIWVMLNLIILIGYLFFFLRKILPGTPASVNDLYLLILVLASYPVFTNFTYGQVEVFLLVCAGEFIRYAVKKMPFLSGIWLGGLLLKPQLLILIIPIFLILRNWKVLMGFIASSFIILMTSLLLSGFNGMKNLINLWTSYSIGYTTNIPEMMINWRMFGLNLNYLLNTSVGWVITSLGMLVTILAVYLLIKQYPPFGSPLWIMTMLGVFSATLAITWHSHAHMAMVLIPFLVFALVNKSLPKNLIFLWAIVSPLAWFGMVIVNRILLVLTKFNTPIYQVMVIAYSGLILNLAILISTFQLVNNRTLKQNKIPEEYSFNLWKNK